MASRGMKIEMAMALVLVVALWSGGAKAQSDCSTVLITLSPCLNYITGNSSTPTSSCCTQLGSVVRSNPRCLCEVLNDGGSSLGVNINQTQAMALASTCNVQTPSLSLCNAASPARSPAAAPVSSSGGGASKAVPSTNNGKSEGNSIKLPVSLLFCLVFIASYASTLTTI